jgi:rhodanese-related sulfurtransferase
VIDVREQHEIDTTGTIPGAIALPRGILERDIGKVVKQNDSRDVVVYCAGGFRSILAAESLVRLGYGITVEETENGSNAQDNKDKPRVWSLNEGMDGWIKSGFEVEKKNKN